MFDKNHTLFRQKLQEKNPPQFYLRRIKNLQFDSNNRTNGILIELIGAVGSITITHIKNPRTVAIILGLGRGPVPPLKQSNSQLI